jgi:hypothetical protein
MPRLSMPCLAAAFLFATAAAPFAAEEDAVRKPMMFAEAKLPAGFPGPGPVGEVIVKTYPAHRLARVRSTGSGNDGSFMKLFRHIERNDIKMTAPVEMVMDEQGPDPAPASTESMAFLYGDAAIGEPGPDPADPSVVVEDMPELTVVSLGVRGSYREERFADFVEKLRAWLKSHPEWIPAGPPRTLAYNSPFVPGPLKYAEVQLPVAPAPKPAGP